MTLLRIENLYRAGIDRTAMRGWRGNSSRPPVIGAARNVTSQPASAISAEAWISGG